ncbi:hypothetical protein DITRI_Ditri13aG0126400 [Diplodiscus trichospermus]
MKSLPLHYQNPCCIFEKGRPPYFSHGTILFSLSPHSPQSIETKSLDLLKDAKVEAILGAQTSTEARSPFFVQIGDDQTSEIKGVAALIQLYKWRNVILIHEQNDLDLDNDDTISYLAALLEEKNICISFMSSIAASSEDDQIIEQLHELKTLQTTVFIVHLPHSVASRLFLNTKRLGMIDSGYAWIVTSKSMNHFNSRSYSSIIIESMQGIIGFRSYIPTTNEMHNFITSRLRRKFYADQVPDEMQSMQLNLGLMAYDVAWSLAKAAKRVVVKVPGTSKRHARSNSPDLDIYISSICRSTLLQEILRSKFKGLGGEFRFINGKLISNTFEIVNVIGSGEKRVGFCTSSGKITKELVHGSSHRRQLSDCSNNLDSIIWPGGCTTIPQDRRLLQTSKILKIGVTVKIGVSQLVKVTRDPYTNATTVTGFCIDVFKAAMDGLSYQVQYEFIPFMDAHGKSAGTNNDLIHEVYLKTPRHVAEGSPVAEPNGIRFSSILVGRWEQLRNKWSMFVAVVSLFVLFILSSSYTATLTSMMTIQHIELNSKRSYIGYQAGSINITTGVLMSNLNFENNTLKPFVTTEEYANALSKGSKNGGVSAILMRHRTSRYSLQSILLIIPWSNPFLPPMVLAS